MLSEEKRKRFAQAIGADDLPADSGILSVVEDMLRQERYAALEEAAQLLDRRALGGTAYNAAAREVRGLKGI